MTSQSDSVEVIQAKYDKLEEAHRKFIAAIQEVVPGFMSMRTHAAVQALSESLRKDMGI